MSEQIVNFHCGKNRVYGILHRPDGLDESTHHPGMIFLNAGSRYRVGPYRLYIQLARRLANAGISVLRFDLPGIGDSDGILLDASDYQRKFIDQKEGAAAAINFMHDEVGIEDIGLIGLCGGAFGALRAGVVNSRVRFLILLSLPVEELGDLSEESVQSLMLRQYLRNALQWRSWRNLFLLRTNFRTMGKAMTRVRHIHKQLSMADESLWNDFQQFTKSRPVLLIYGNSDPLCKSFQSIYPSRIAKLRSQQRDRCTTLIIENANHTFSKRHWQQQLADTSISWLARIGADNKSSISA